MKRIALIVGVVVLGLVSSAEAQRRGGYSYNYAPQYSTQPRVVTSTPAAQPAVAAPAVTTVQKVVVPTPTTTAPASAVSLPVQQPAPQPVVKDFSTATAQGVANIMASRGVVGHFGGNSGYEGCGMASTPQAAYNMCCYANSGMATVDVGYAQGSNGMWYCCRRYR